MKGMVNAKTGGKVTGFASPAQGYEEASINLNTLLIKHPSASRLFQLDSSDMGKLGLSYGTLLVVDSSIKPNIGQFAMLRHEGMILCRRMEKQNGKTVFTLDNSFCTILF
jgi:DNA polymerase V